MLKMNGNFELKVKQVVVLEEQKRRKSLFWFL